jgi:hypothetical protein
MTVKKHFDAGSRARIVALYLLRLTGQFASPDRSVSDQNISGAFSTTRQHCQRLAFSDRRSDELGTAGALRAGHVRRNVIVKNRERFFSAGPLW